MLGLTACAGPKGNDGAPGGVTPDTVTITPDVENSIADTVQEYNEDRVTQGQDPVTAGLSCSLYTVPNTTTQITGASLTRVGGWTYAGIFNDANGPSAPGLSVLPAPIRGVYTSYYVIKCTGVFIAPIAGWYEFELSSDDGAILSVGGSLINNDGTHGITTKSAVKFLSRGASSFELDYFDIGGSHALMLLTNGVPVSAQNFYH